MENVVSGLDVHYQFADFFEDERVKPFAWLLSMQMQAGHICLNLDEKIKKEEHPDLFKAYKLLSEELDTEALNGCDQWISLNGEKRPLIIQNKKLYLYRYFNYEGNIVNCIKALIKNEHEEKGIRLKKLEAEPGIIKTTADLKLPAGQKDWQLVASLLGYLNNFTIITGGPGTGKTTTVAKILDIIYKLEPGCRVAIAAPTGKAAMRVKESLLKNETVSVVLREKINQELEPKTIHRLLGTIHQSPYFKHNSDNYLEYDLVIVDEASMIDVALFSKLLSAVNPKSRLILMGDKNQLASVDAGSILGDLCKSLPKLNLMTKETIDFVNQFIDTEQSKIPVDCIVEANLELLFEHIIELKNSRRFLDDSAIGIFSKAILSGDEKSVRDFINGNQDPSLIFDTEYKTDLFEDFVAGYQEVIGEKKANHTEDDTKAALGNLTNLRVLCAVKDGDKGLNKINQRIEKYLLKNGLISSTADVYSNKLIIVTKNYHDLELFNGDVGIVRRDNNGQHRVWFFDKKNELRSVVPGLIPEVETVFAMTIHKSQGSEYNNVLIVLPDNKDNPLLTRELLYTAITRAKSKVIIQGSIEVILETIKNEVKRTSGISKRINQ